jgi:hypothetical protein
MTRPDDRRTAWRDIDVMLFALATLVGVGAWITASVGVGYAKTANGELAWANLGIVGLIIFGSGNALWLLRGRGAIGTRRASLVRLEAARAEPAGHAADQLPPPTSAVQGGLVRVAGGRLLHQASCPLVVGKKVDRIDAASSPRTAPCQVCSP